MGQHRPDARLLEEEFGKPFTWETSAGEAWSSGGDAFLACMAENGRTWPGRAKRTELLGAPLRGAWPSAIRVPSSVLLRLAAPQPQPLDDRS